MLENTHIRWNYPDVSVRSNAKLVNIKEEFG